VQEAILNQKLGKEIKADRKRKDIISPELNRFLESNARIKDSFITLSPAKQREYAEYISEAKRSETKQKRLEKIIPMILGKIGLNDKYK
jgi:uncharacterized protein YdeI (YjbR/CyaY-like superfamily)